MYLKKSWNGTWGTDSFRFCDAMIWLFRFRIGGKKLLLLAR
jgi:hypothetical protein